MSREELFDLHEYGEAVPMVENPVDKLEWDAPFDKYEVTKNYKYLEKIARNNIARKKHLAKLEAVKDETMKLINSFDAVKGKVGLTDSALDSFYKQFTKKFNQLLLLDGRIACIALRKRINSWIDIRERRFPEESEKLKAYRASYNTSFALPKGSRVRQISKLPASI